MVRKIKAEYENPIDNILLDICESLTPYFKNLDFTPNDITTMSLITGILSIISLQFKLIPYFIIFYILSYFFDCLDGHYARKYNMVTKFGDLYDHFKDALISILVIYVLFFTHNIKPNMFIFILLGILLVGAGIHMGLQQSLYKYTAPKKCMDESLDNLTKINHLLNIGDSEESTKKYIQYSKYLGCGTTQFAIPLIIMNLL